MTTWSTTDKAGGIALSNGDLTATGVPDRVNRSGRASAGIAAGEKRFWSVKFTSLPSDNSGVGIATEQERLNTRFGASAHSAAWYGQRYYDGAAGGWTKTRYYAGDVVDFAVDRAARLLKMRVNGGVWDEFDISHLVGSTFYPGYTLQGAATLVANFGASAFAYPPPAGFTAFDGKKEEQSPAPAVDNGYISVEAFRRAGEADDTAMIRRAAAAVRAAPSGPWAKRGLYAPPGRVYSISDYIDLTGIHTVRWESWIAVNFNPIAAPAIRCRVPSRSLGGDYYFFGIWSSTPYNALRQPVLQFSGLRGARAEVLSCPYIEVFGDSVDNAYASTAYSRFYFGQVQRLEIRDDAASRNAWVNTNQFYGGSICQLRIGGPWRSVASITNSGRRTRIKTSEPHGYTTGNLVEIYNGTPGDAVFGLVTVIDSVHFDVSGSLSGSGWRCMGPPGYPHNDNVFYNPGIEDAPAIIHIQGSFNRLLGCRLEARGPCVFGPESTAIGNIVEQSNSTHGRLPHRGENIDMTVTDYSGGKNFTGWPRMPGNWGA